MKLLDDAVELGIPFESDNDFYHALGLDPLSEGEIV